ncbi:hypothetical protein DFQ28_002390 [Apophysomyces sp. BC1034]|nr:hypothetical protein DFQ30_002941 [Apophysomyces sp. BC1015]KAG0179176.1 hypothetical protein DFQ29_002431 [Apophysomyces sp. BC1021]KAG0190203.1 hypothetical protein DFQ28_002390 [Apophysomyces sp. BC1034]
MAQSLSVYRQLLREVNRQYTKVADNGLYVKELKSIYRQNKDIKDPVRIAALNQDAENILVFLRSSRQHKELRARYSALVLEQKKKIELSAKRVGLQLPKQFDPAAPQPLTRNGATDEAAIADRVTSAFTK